MVGRFFGMLLLSSGQMWKTLCDRRFGEPFNGQVIPFVAMVEYPISGKYQPRLRQFGKKVPPDSSDMHWLRESGKEMLWLPTVRSWDNWTRKIHFPNRRYTCREWKSQRRTSKKLEPQPVETKEDAEARNDLWSIEGDFTYRHRTETRFHLYVPKEESFPISILTWPEQLTQIWMWCKKNVSTIWWNVDMGRNLIRFMDSIHEVHVTDWETSSRNYVVWERITNIQATTRLDYLWPEIWIGTSWALE